MDAWDELLALGSLDPDSDVFTWVDLRTAEARAGVSRSALRSWYRSDQVPSRVVQGPHGPQRMVALEAVADRAHRSPRLRHRSVRDLSLEAQVVLLGERVAALERRLAAVEGR